MNNTTLSKTTSNFNPFAGPTVEKVIHITPSQAEIWIACKLGGEDANRGYNESVSLILKGELNQIALEFAIQNLVKRHEALRATFSTDGQFMTVFDEITVIINYQDFSSFNLSEKAHKVSDYLSGDANHTFDLVKGPLLKIGLLKLAEFEHQFVITAHHIICDGWSMGIMLQDIGALYTAHTKGETTHISKPETYSSYADQQQEFIESEEFIKTQKYWIEQYKSPVPLVTMPTDFPRPEIKTFKSNRLDFPISYDLVADLKKVGITSGSSLVVTIMTAFEVFLYFQTGQDDLVLGLPAAGQSVSGKSHLVGHCVNLLPLRSKIESKTPFNTYLKGRKNDIFDAYEHQHFSFGQLLQKLNIARDPSRVPLVPVVFNIDMGMAKDVRFGDLSYKLKSNPRAYEAFELFMNATGTEDKLVLEWSYNVSLFKPETIAQMMDSFKEVLHTIIENPSIEIGEIIKLDHSVYTKLNDTTATYPDLALHELLAKQAQRTPFNIALKFEDSEINYEKLEKQIHQVAHYLSENGIDPNDHVAVALPKSIELVIILIAIMECGAAYLPLDPNLPSQRLDFMLQDSQAKHLITTKMFSSEKQFGVNQICLEDIFSDLSKHPTTSLDVKVDNNQIAYLLYTSGSTGKPKGVRITHKSLVNLLFSVIEKPGIKETDILISITTISFDISVAELFAPLLKGAKLILADEETAKDTRILLDLIKQEKVTIMQATPTTWQMLLDSGWKNKLPIKALSTGEALPLNLAKIILKKVNELWNLYGPTETTIWSAITQIKKSDNLITIGRPINNTKLYIVDKHGDLVAPGNTGELYVAGDGVAKGYWRRRDLTSQMFIKNKFDPDSEPLLYRTGDLAKLLPSGNVQCLGRMDQQVKIRGHRIELGEIEQALDAFKNVQSSIVLLNENRLIAYIISSEKGKQNINQIAFWQESLKQQLPAYMVPHQFNVIKEFPMTLNGKIDRKALRALSFNKTDNGFSTEPTTPSEKIVANIWQDCLGIDKIDIHSDFFEIGGHSLVGVRVMAKIEKETGNRLPLIGLLKHPTIKKFAAYMDREFFTWDSLVPLKPEGTKPPLYIVHGANHQVLIFNELAQGLDKEQPVFGLQSRGLSGVDEPHDSIHEMAADYISEIVASNPDGPYALAGFSYGGIVAYEMARQLKEQGREVKILAQFDTYVFPEYYYNHPLKKKTLSVLYLMGKVVYLILNMFSSKKNFLRRLELIKLQISGLKLRVKHGKAKQFEMQFNVPLKMQTNHNIATGAYTITPQDIVIDLFRAREEVNFVHDPEYLGWKKMALKGIRKHMVTGNHVDMFEKQNVKDFATSLQYILDHHNSDSYE